MEVLPPAPEPPVEMPPARTVNVPGHGEMFLRDTGDTEPARPVVMLLHGWIANADLNWYGAYGDLARAGYRVLAPDHRGHGRGLRPLVRFRLADCAADAAALLRTLGVAPAIVVGYSMGGAIAQLIARDHPDVISGLVLSGTAQHWQEPQVRRVWRSMGAFGLMLSLSPRGTWRAGFRRLGLPRTPETAWLQSELLRNSARDVADAGRELGRFDSRPWLRAAVRVPSAVVVTTRDEAVPPRKQRELAAALGARVFEAPIRHIVLVPEKYNPALLEALAAVRTAHEVKAA
ncbi:MAG TPA: alpha/beta fold hydrolase [Solirubrobacteraceae bacterium]|nr:alpha/beta fold hydrolase [Solirubrobacteraceae bacterium]